MEDILLSVSCTSYNHEKYIKDALDGFLNQKVNFRYEILVHDDASTDKTTQIIKEYEKKHPEIIKPIYQAQNQYSKGKQIHYCFNHTRAKGKYIAWCEGDDYWIDLNKLQKQVDYLEKNPNCSICCHGSNAINEDSKITERITPFHRGTLFSLVDLLEKNITFSTATICYRKKLLDNVPSFYYDCPVGDVPLKMFLLEKGYGYYLPEIMAVYRKNITGSWTDRFDNNHKKSIAHQKEMITFLRQFNEHFNHKYETAINTYIQKKENLILIHASLMDYSNRKTSEFSPLYRQLNTIEKLSLFLRCKLPWFFEGVKKVTYDTKHILEKMFD